MSQRSLFVVLFVVLFAACEEDTIISLNAVTFTKSHLSNIAESARRAAEQTDILAARLAVFTDSAAGLANSAIAFADSARVAAVLLAAADHDLRVAHSAASSFFLYEKDEAKVIEKANKAYWTTSASDARFAAEQAYAAAAQAVAEADSRRVDTYRQAVRDSVYAVRIAVRDSAYVTPPISTAIAALATSKTAYQACATHIDSILNSIESHLAAIEAVSRFVCASDA